MRPVAAASFPQRSVERLKATPYGEERDRAAREILSQLESEPGMKPIVAAAREWGVESDDWALRRLLEEVEAGQRDVRKLALVATPLLADRAVRRSQLESFSRDPICRLGAELWDATGSENLRDSIHRSALSGSPEDTPLSFFWVLKVHARFASPRDKEAMAGAVFRAVERDPREKWVVDSLRAWETPLDWATLEKACDIWSRGGANELALKVTDPKDFVMQRRQLRADPLALALHEAVAEPKKAQVWSQAMRGRERLLENCLGSYYSSGPEEDEALYRAVWPALRDTPSGQLMESWGLRNLAALKWTAREPQVKDRWLTALAVTPEDNPAAMKQQLAELDTPAGRLAVRLLPHLRENQVRTVWERVLRQRQSATPEHLLKVSLAGTGVDEEQSLELVKLLWTEKERTSEQVAEVQSLMSIARGPGFSYLVERLAGRRVLSDAVRAELLSVRDKGWSELRPVLEKVKREADQEDAMRKMMGENRDPSSGIKESGDAIEVGGIRVPKRRASSG